MQLECDNLEALSLAQRPPRSLPRLTLPSHVREATWLMYTPACPPKCIHALSPVPQPPIAMCHTEGDTWKAPSEGKSQGIRHWYGHWVEILGSWY
jgi:hypothetical protein